MIECENNGKEAKHSERHIECEKKREEVQERERETERLGVRTINKEE